MPRKQAVVLGLILALSGALLGVTLTLSAYATFGPISYVDGEEHQTLESSDGSWLVRSRLVDPDRDLSWATIERADGGVTRMVYYGPAANGSWRGSTLVFTEQQSGEERVIDPATGSYDWRTDDRVNLIGAFVLWSLAVLAVIALDAYLLRRWTRGDHASPASNPVELAR